MEENETQVEENKSRRNMSVVSLVALGLSISALLVSVFEVSAIREEQKIQVWPYVDVFVNYSAEGFALNIKNKGIGPARIRTVEIALDGEPITDLDQLIVDTIGPEDAFSYDLYRSSNPSRDVMSPDETVVLFAVPWEERTRRLSEAWSGRISIAVCYCSVYDECWTAELNGDEPMPVSQCTVRSEG